MNLLITEYLPFHKLSNMIGNNSIKISENNFLPLRQVVFNTIRYAIYVVWAQESNVQIKLTESTWSK